MSAEEFFQTSFFARLGGGQRLARSPSPSQLLAELWGVDLAVALAQWLDFLGTQPDGASPRLGDLYAFEPADWLPQGNSFEYMLVEWFRRAALLSGTVPIGASGSGDIWLVEAAPLPRVFLLDHDLNEVEIVADSVEAFALLCSLNEQSGERVLTTDDWGPLAGRIRGTKDMRVVGPTLASDAGAEVTARHAAVDELLGCLWFRHVPKPLASKLEPHADLAAPVLVEHMLRHYLREDDGALEPLLALGSLHRARIVRDATSSLTANLSLRGFDARHEALHTK